MFSAKFFNQYNFDGNHRGDSFEIGNDCFLITAVESKPHYTVISITHEEGNKIKLIYDFAVGKVIQVIYMD